MVEHEHQVLSLHGIVVQLQPEPAPRTALVHESLALVPTDPGKKVGQVGDWMAVATKNCTVIHNNSCGGISCKVDGNYDGKPGKPTGWLQAGGDSTNPRVISLFIVPYQGLKNAQGSGDPIPILGFASFYVLNWGGTKGDNDPYRTPISTPITIHRHRKLLFRE